MQLHLQTWPDVERYLLRSQSIIIPIGSTEQHGPNGLIGTDALCAEAVARGVGEKADALVAPTISVGMAQHHLGFPGSMTLSPTTLIAVIKDWVFSLSRHGFRRFYFINGHGGNIATVTAAFSEIYTVSSMDGAGNQASLQCRLRNWWQADGISSLSRELYGSSEGSHATPSEVSMTWHLFPEAARPMRMDPEVAPNGEFADAADYRRRFPDGRIGSNPGLATGEAGKRLLDLAVTGLAADYQRWAAA
ncbi:MAG: creatininase family protein [Dongiales bacterium]